MPRRRRAPQRTPTPRQPASRGSRPRRWRRAPRRRRAGTGTGRSVGRWRNRRAAPERRKRAPRPTTSARAGWPRGHRSARRSGRPREHDTVLIPFSAVSDVALLPLQAASALIHSRRASSVDLVRACLDRIARHDRELGAFITLTAESALTEAKRADADLANGVDRGPLHGIPVALKDLYDTAGLRTTGGSRIFADRVPERDSAVVEKLRAAGAVFLGKLNLHEWALGVTNQNPHFGPACNPWDTSRIPGGSSGGSAIAVASGFCYVSPGSDTGGSIRIPASLCGVAGLKPTYGRVSLRGVIPLAWTLDHSGPLARTVGDLAIALNAIAGHDPLDPASVDVASEDYAASLEDGAKDVRVVVPANFFFDDVDPEVDAAVREAARVLASLGASVAE